MKENLIFLLVFISYPLLRAYFSSYIEKLCFIDLNALKVFVFCPLAYKSVVHKSQAPGYPW